ncbi:MAG: hypothetical protein B6D58_00900 [candidate division Zixibacteria bacterium 4484_95]|nr:MAG: hypothetical protein B6D58_00900 [candidate division Zixibacteria bacterium 4484_95]
MSQTRKNFNSNIRKKYNKNASDVLDERVRALRVELAQRTIDIQLSDQKERKEAKDSPYAEKVGKEISKLINEERLEEARKRLEEELDKHPKELMFLNLQMALDMLDKPFGSYEKAKKFGSILMEIAVEKNNAYYTMVAIGNMGLIAHNEGHDEFSKAMYLVAHFIDKKEIFPMCNLAGWYARRGELEEAQKWIDKILNNYPDWLERDDIVTFLKKDESLSNLREYAPYKEKVLSKIEEQ